jgi:hypothetical protein
MSPALQRRYGGLVAATLAQTAAHIGRGLSADKAGAVIAVAATASRPRTRYTVGRDAALIVASARLLTDRAMDRAIALGLRPFLPKKSPQAA